ncbi:hypothetical protein F5887DRAFT_1249993 [Amanita rubescens]|nr:hypothetical protein F5887DRAFT_1249993 [Amanita rubescens]
MLFNANLLALAALLAAGVHAQTPSSASSTAVPTSTSQIPPCVLTCVEAALQSTNGACTSITSPCVCTNTAFQQSAATCLASKCTASDAAAAAQLEKAVCTASTSGSTTATGTGAASAPSGTTTASGSSAPRSSGGSVSSSTTSAATSTASKSAGAKITFDHANLFALAVGVVGAVFGGLMA